MNANLFLQIFLLINIFLMGVLAAIAARHAYAHFKRPQEEPKPQTPTTPQIHLPPEFKARLIGEAEHNFLFELNRSIAELQKDLKDTSTHLNDQLQKLGSEVAISERGRYYSMLEEQRKRTEAAIVAAQDELGKHQAELKAKIDQEEATLKAKLTETMTAEQQRLVKQIDTKLADAVATFLTETLQHNVDLGAQTAYLTATLEQHKDDFKREVQDETQAAK